MSTLIAIWSGVSGLIGVALGGIITYVVQKNLAVATVERNRKALAAALAAEIDAYLELMEVRDWSAFFSKLAARLRSGEDLKLARRPRDDERPLDQFPYFQSEMSKIGLFDATLCSDLARFYTRVAAVRSTNLDAERGMFDMISPTDRADVIERELKIFENTLKLGRNLVTRLQAVCNDPRT